MELVFGIPTKQREVKTEKYPNQAVLTLLPQDTNAERVYCRFEMNNKAMNDLFNTGEEKLFGSIYVNQENDKLYLCNVSSLGDSLEKNKKFTVNKGTQTFSDKPIWNFMVSHFSLNPEKEANFLLGEVSEIQEVKMAELSLIANETKLEEVVTEEKVIEETVETTNSENSYEAIDEEVQYEMNQAQAAEYEAAQNAEAEAMYQQEQRDLF